MTKVIDQRYYSRHIRDLAASELGITTSDSKREQQLDDLGDRIAKLLDVVYGYTFIDDAVAAGQAYETDDEILNWTFGDVIDDLNAAHWNLACGFYKTAASCLRNALDMAVCALHFQVRENTEPPTNYCNEFFNRWDRGQKDTPNWGEMMAVINKSAHVKEFNDNNSCDLLAEAHRHFKYLCNFTHGRPFDAPGGLPTNSMNIGTGAPGFEIKAFERFIELFKETVAWMVVAWLVTFPEIFSTNPLSASPPYNEYLNLLHHKMEQEVMSHIKAGT